jgi:hypothetical protein
VDCVFVICSWRALKILCVEGNFTKWKNNKKNESKIAGSTLFVGKSFNLLIIFNLIYFLWDEKKYN